MEKGEVYVGLRKFNFFYGLPSSFAGCVDDCLEQ